MPDAKDIYEINADNWVTRHILDEVVIMPLCRSEEDMRYIYSISDETGKRIFELLDGQNSVKQIQEVLKKEFRGKSQDIEEGVLIFIRDLLSVKLLQKSGKPGPMKGRVSGESSERRALKEKKPYREPEITKVKMEPEQAVLSCCMYSRYGKLCGGGWTGGNWCDRGATCGPTNCNEGNYSAGWNSAGT
jgi:hypothetical protein